MNRPGEVMQYQLEACHILWLITWQQHSKEKKTCLLAVRLLSWCRRYFNAQKHGNYSQFSTRKEMSRSPQLPCFLCPWKVSWRCWMKISPQKSVMLKWWHISCLTLSQQAVGCLKSINAQKYPPSAFHRQRRLQSTCWSAHEHSLPFVIITQWHTRQEKKNWWDGKRQQDRLENEWQNVKFKVPFKYYFAYAFMINLFIIQMKGNEIELLIGNNHSRHPSSNESWDFKCYKM